MQAVLSRSVPELLVNIGRPGEFGVRLRDEIVAENEILTAAWAGPVAGTEPGLLMAEVFSR